jgi:hypothetical protein
MTTFLYVLQSSPLMPVFLFFFFIVEHIDHEIRIVNLVSKSRRLLIFSIGLVHIDEI